LHVDPKMSFGTGHHETTRLSLKLLEKYVTGGIRVLDFGCGTGVLGIACIKLGAGSVIAVDIDPWSIENTKENIKQNKVERRMKVRLGSISSIPKIKYDLIAANIDFITISRFIKSIAGMARKNGIVILSGILTGDLPALQPIFKNNMLVKEQVIMENEWSAIALRRI
ncbi:MAG: 50S ribosomal protein L11 methyltransferase, partial [Bacteroidetes bacterium]|nr:50S ribosomal protein L11 methyltransferase [Bacteroidota bacterium]